MVETMKFYDLKNKKHFTTSNYKTKTRSVKGTKRKYAVARSPHKGKFEYWRALPKDFKR